MNNVYSVIKVNRYIKHMINSDFLLGNIRVEGEVSNTVYNRSGHIYFTLKDEYSSLDCVMFAGNRHGLQFPMKDGDKVIVSGRVDIYEKAGSYKLYAVNIELAGLGILYEKFLALKNELEERGMFADVYKKNLPGFPRSIGVVTAATGAAIRDIASISKRRNPGIRIVLYPAVVQGEKAAASIVRGIDVLDRYGVDVIIVGRGGGSIEDLWAFNEEEVAYAIFNCNTPVISAVGHETDFTIADFVADLRAPTPSAAAELAVPDIYDILESLNAAEKKLGLIMQGKTDAERLRLKAFLNRLNALSPQNKLLRIKERLNAFKDIITVLEKNYISDKKHVLGVLAERLDGLSPLKKLSQGYSFVNDSSGKAVTSIGTVDIGDILTINVSDGIIEAETKSIKEAVRING